MNEKVERISKEYLNYKLIDFDPDFNQIFVINNKNQRYPLVYVDTRRVIMTLNEGLSNEEATEVKKNIAEYIIQAIKEKKSREKNAKYKNEKNNQ